MNKWLNMFTWGGREVGGMDSGVQGVWCDMLWGGWRGEGKVLADVTAIFPNKAISYG